MRLPREWESSGREAVGHDILNLSMFSDGNWGLRDLNRVTGGELESVWVELSSSL